MVQSFPSLAERSPMKTVATRLIIVCVLSNLGSVGAQAQSNQGAAVAMPRTFMVAAVAYRDLESRLKEWESKSTARGSTESEAQKYDSDIRNYTVELLEYSGKIYATFSLRPLRVESASSGNFQCRPMAGVSWINQAAPPQAVTQSRFDAIHGKCAIEHAWMWGPSGIAVFRFARFLAITKGLIYNHGRVALEVSNHTESAGLSCTWIPNGCDW